MCYRQDQDTETSFGLGEFHSTRLQVSGRRTGHPFSLAPSFLFSWRNIVTRLPPGSLRPSSRLLTIRPFPFLFLLLTGGRVLPDPVLWPNTEVVGSFYVRWLIVESVVMSHFGPSSHTSCVPLFSVHDCGGRCRSLDPTRRRGPVSGRGPPPVCDRVGSTKWLIGTREGGRTRPDPIVCPRTHHLPSHTWHSGWWWHEST